jgi:hypothetical protein
MGVERDSAPTDKTSADPGSGEGVGETVRLGHDVSEGRAAGLHLTSFDHGHHKVSRGA